METGGDNNEGRRQLFTNGADSKITDMFMACVLRSLISTIAQNEVNVSTYRCIKYINIAVTKYSMSH